MKLNHNERMKVFSRIPMYAGFSVFAISVILSAVKVSENRSVTNLSSSAAVAQVMLSLSYSKPNLVSVLLTSTQDVAGLDVGVSFDSNILTILPTSLTGGPGVVTTGGVLNEEGGTFSFSALPQGSAFASGIVATFTIAPKDGKSGSTTISFDTKNSHTAVLSRGTNLNVLSKTESVTIKF
jgi:hypothetical protein